MATAQEYLDAGNEFFEEEKFEDAITCYSEVINLAPNFSDGYYQRGICYEKLNEYNQAIADFSTVIKLDPNNKQSYLDIVDCYIKIGQYVMANINLDECFRRIDINELGSSFYYEDIFNRLIYLGRFDDAIFLRLNYIVSSNPIEYYIYRALTCIKMEYDNRALNYFKMALRFRSWDGGLHRYIAEYYEMATGYLPGVCSPCSEIVDAYNNAIDYYSHNIRKNITEFDLLLRAICYQRLGEYDKAIDDLSKRIKIGENKVPQYFIDRAICYIDWHKYDNAKQDYRKAIEICHKDSNNRYTYKYSYRYDDKTQQDLLGLCYEKIGEKEKAKNSYLEAIQYYTKRIEKYNDADDYAIRADCYERIGNYEKAIEDYTNAIEYVNSGVFYFILRAKCYKEMGNYEKAIEDYKKALVNETESIDTIIDIQNDLNDIAEITSTSIKIFDNPEIIMQTIQQPFDNYDDSEDFSDDHEKEENNIISEIPESSKHKNISALHHDPKKGRKLDL